MNKSLSQHSFLDESDRRTDQIIGMAMLREVFRRERSWRALQPAGVEGNFGIGSEKGMATLETIPFLVLFVLLLTYALGLYGIIQTGIMQSIAAREYAFETFRNRPNLVYFRDRLPEHYVKRGYRLHAVISEKHAGRTIDGDFHATDRPLHFGQGPGAQDRNINTDRTYHNETVHGLDDQRRMSSYSGSNVGVSPAWITIAYGICLNAKCGD